MSSVLSSGMTVTSRLMSCTTPDDFSGCSAVGKMLLILLHCWRLCLLGKLGKQGIRVISQQVQVLVKEAGKLQSCCLVQAQDIFDSLAGCLNRAVLQGHAPDCAFAGGTCIQGRQMSCYNRRVMRDGLAKLWMAPSADSSWRHSCRQLLLSRQGFLSRFHATR